MVQLMLLLITISLNYIVVGGKRDLCWVVCMCVCVCERVLMPVDDKYKMRRGVHACSGEASLKDS